MLTQAEMTQCGNPLSTGDIHIFHSAYFAAVLGIRQRVSHLLCALSITKSHSITCFLLSLFIFDQGLTALTSLALNSPFSPG